MNIFTGSELNRLARQFVTAKDKELKDSGQFARFQDWQLVIDSEENVKRLDIRYSVKQRNPVPGRPSIVLGNRARFGSINL